MKNKIKEIIIKAAKMKNKHGFIYAYGFLQETLAEEFDLYNELFDLCGNFRGDKKDE